MKFFLSAILPLLVILISCSKNDPNPAPEPLISQRVFYSMSQVVNGTTSSEIYSSNLDGTDERKLTNLSSNGTLGNHAMDLTFNADSSKLIFVSSSHYDGKLMMMNLNGSGITTFPSLFGTGIYQPILLPGGEKIVFWKAINIAPNIYIRQLFSSSMDGSDLQELTSYPSDGSFIYSPSINYSNNTIVYQCDVNSNFSTNVSGIYSMNFDGSNKQLLVAYNNIYRGYPEVSRYGNQIVYMSLVNSKNEIFKMNLDGSNIIQLTNYSNNGSLSKHSRLPRFSHDGSLIYFSSDESGHSQIYQMKHDGSEKRQLTISSGYEKFSAIVKL